LENFDTDKNCSKCKANLSAASNFCPLCGWPKNRRMVHYEADEEKVANNIKSNPSPKEPTESIFENEIPRPTGVRLLGIFHLIFGIFLVAIAILAGSAVMFLVMGNAMNIHDTTMSSLGGLGDMGDMPIPLGMGGVDPTMMSSLNMINGLPGMEGLPSTSEIERATNSAASEMNMEIIMELVMETFVIAVIVIILGIFTVVVGIGLLRGKKWARIVTIASAIISIPLAALYLGKLDILIILGSVALDGIILYYMFKPQIKEYFIQTSIENSIKNSKIKT